MKSVVGTVDFEDAPEKGAIGPSLLWASFLASFNVWNQIG